MDYVDKLTALRIDNDLAQSDIAKLLGCRQSAISEYEPRKVPYRIEDVINLCKFYNLSVHYLFDLPENMPYPKRKKEFYFILEKQVFNTSKNFLFFVHNEMN